MTLVLADAAGFDHMGGFGWGMMGIGWLIMLAIVGLVVWAVIQSSSRSTSPTGSATGSAERILAERYARGDIDSDEYRERLSELQH